MWPKNNHLQMTSSKVKPHNDLQTNMIHHLMIAGLLVVRLDLGLLPCLGISVVNAYIFTANNSSGNSFWSWQRYCLLLKQRRIAPFREIRHIRRLHTSNYNLAIVIIVSGWGYSGEKIDHCSDIIWRNLSSCNKVKTVIHYQDQVIKITPTRKDGIHMPLL